MLPLQLVDSFLLDYHVGHVLILAFVASLAGTVPLKSQKAVAGVVMGFGLIFVIAPSSLLPGTYVLFGLALAIVGPLLWATADS